MASPSCQRCLLRASIPYAASRSSVRPPRTSIWSNSFSTTPVVSFVKSKKKGKGKESRGKPPAPGERKAARKRIVLSNTNALEVQGMQDLTPADLLETGNIGKVFAFPGTVVDSLRAVEAFKVTQPWGMFRKPSVLIREDSIKLARILEEAEQKKSTQSFIVDGSRSSGKSIMLLQAAAAAFLKKWVVFHIPEGKKPTVLFY